MSSFLRRRAQALMAEAEVLRAQGVDDEALKRLQTAFDLLRECNPSSAEAPALLRRIGTLCAGLGDEDLSDRSFLEARRREVAQDR